MGMYITSSYVIPRMSPKRVEVCPVLLFGWKCNFFIVQVFHLEILEEQIYLGCD